MEDEAGGDDEDGDRDDVDDVARGDDEEDQSEEATDDKDADDDVDDVAGGDNEEGDQKEDVVGLVAVGDVNDEEVQDGNEEQGRDDEDDEGEGDTGGPKRGFLRPGDDAMSGGMARFWCLCCDGGGVGRYGLPLSIFCRCQKRQKRLSLNEQLTSRDSESFKRWSKRLIPRASSKRWSKVA